jgi:cob(I)alamin adenosyltransferase
MMNFYSGQGDDGRTHTLRSGKLSKCDLIIEAIGTVDEASAFFSLAAIHIQDEGMKALIKLTQDDLYIIMAEIAGDDQTKLSITRIAWLEEKIDFWGKELELSHEFINNWKNPASALLNVTRTVVRRAERRLVECFEKKKINNPEILRYLNRLSSLIYVLQLHLENDLQGK